MRTPTAPNENSDTVIKFGCLNVRSIAGKVDILLDIIPLNEIGILMLVETWHDDGSVALQRLRRAGYSVVDRPRPREGCVQKSLLTNHGGLAVIATEVIQLRSRDINCTLKTFEYLAVQVRSGNEHINILIIYRTGALQSQFYLELSEILGRMLIASPRFFVAGDINIHLERQEDPENRTFRNLIASLGLRLIIDGPTHDRGGTLDIVLERHSESIPPTYVLNLDTGLSDHLLPLWTTTFLTKRPSPEVHLVRRWRGLDIHRLSELILDSPLCSPEIWAMTSLDQMATLYNQVLTDFLDKHLPTEILRSHGHCGGKAKPPQAQKEKRCRHK